MKNKDKIIILTGGSRGIGHATSKNFGMMDGMLLLSQDQKWHQNAHGLIINNFISKLILKMRKNLKKHDLNLFLDGRPVKALINNAAISPKNKKNERLNFNETSLSLWRSVFNVNFFAPILISKAIVENLKKANGVIINVTSIASDNVHQFAGPAYATSKAALKSLTREMASDLAGYNIRVNAIAPGEINIMVTPNSKQILTEKIPMKRFGKPDEVAGVILSMCSDTFSYVNGTEIQINGGQTV